MRYTGIQPQYFPRLHYFARLLATDIYVIRDDAQYVRKHKYPGDRTDKSYQADTPIKATMGRYLLSVPISHDRFNSLCKTKVAYSHDWVEQHLNSIRFAYGKARRFHYVFPELSDLLTYRYDSLSDLNIQTILWGILHILGESRVGIRTLSIDSVQKKLAKQTVIRLRRILKASENHTLAAHPDATANEKIILLCKEVGATEDYCGGTGVSAYIDHSMFTKAGIAITVQDWKCREYPQLFSSKGFIPNLSILDLLMNVPQEEACRVVLG